MDQGIKVVVRGLEGVGLMLMLWAIVTLFIAPVAGESTIGLGLSALAVFIGARLLRHKARTQGVSKYARVTFQDKVDDFAREVQAFFEAMEQGQIPISIKVVWISEEKLSLSLPGLTYSVSVGEIDACWRDGDALVVHPSLPEFVTKLSLYIEAIREKQRSQELQVVSLGRDRVSFVPLGGKVYELHLEDVLISPCSAKF